MNKEKAIVGIIAIFVVIGAIFTAIMIKKDENKEENKTRDSNDISEEIIDECTEEYEMALKEQSEEANSSEDKISANSRLILKKYYTGCEHTINEYIEMPAELINMTENQVKEEYPEWDVIGFSPNEVILYKEFSDNCQQHFCLKIEDDKIVIYKILENGELELYERLNVGTEYLTETDLINMQDGLEIYGLEELNKIIEDFE